MGTPAAPLSSGVSSQLRLLSLELSASEVEGMELEGSTPSGDAEDRRRWEVRKDPDPCCTSISPLQLRSLDPGRGEPAVECGWDGVGL